MKHAVRALGWATKIFWILIIAFTATAVYSALDIQASLGHPRLVSSNGLLVFSLPLSINNTSYYDLSELNLTATVMDATGPVISQSTTYVPLVQRGSFITHVHNASIDLNDLVQGTPDYLFNDTVFEVNMSLTVRYASAFVFRFSENETLDWGAPLYNFSVGQIVYSPHNATHQKAVVPLSFANHSSFSNVTGTIYLESYSDEAEWIGSGTANVDVSRHAAYDGYIEAFVDSTRLMGSGALHFYFTTSMFDFGPLVMRYG